MEKFSTLLTYSCGETTAVLGDRWWRQAAKQEGGKISKTNLCNIWKKRSERPNVGCVSIGSRSSAPSRKACAFNGQMTNDSAVASVDVSTLNVACSATISGANQR